MVHTPTRHQQLGCCRSTAQSRWHNDGQHMAVVDLRACQCCQRCDLPSAWRSHLRIPHKANDDCKLAVTPCCMPLAAQEAAEATHVLRLTVARAAAWSPLSLTNMPSHSAHYQRIASGRGAGRSMPATNARPRAGVRAPCAPSSWPPARAARRPPRPPRPPPPAPAPPPHLTRASRLPGGMRPAASATSNLSGCSLAAPR